jgi:hypothetical protein
MASDIASYALLGVAFIVTGLRMFVDKPNKVKEIPLPRWGKLLRRTRDR